MKLTVTHLSAYLPYHLDCQITDKGKTKIATLGGVYADGSCVFFDIVESQKGFSEIKPILRPLSDLRQNIGEENTINEHTINLILEEKFELDYGVFCSFQNDIDLELDGDPNLRYDSNKRINFYAVLEAYNELLKGHYDIFFLIEKGLAIDINTINQKQ